MLFNDRTEAGRMLADKLMKYLNQDLVVLAVPRGGVPIGFEIAKRLNAPMDLLIIRKLGAPFNPELGIGAIAQGNVKVLDEEIIAYLKISPEEVENIEKLERKELNRRIQEYKGSNLFPDIKGKIVILVDDGLATGITARVAIKAVLKHHPRRLIIAIPVCALDILEGIKSIIRPIKDEVICLTTPYNFSAVGHWYKNFDQVSDLEVVEMLKQFDRKTSLRPLRGTHNTESEVSLQPIRIR